MREESAVLEGEKEEEEKWIIRYREWNEEMYKSEILIYNIFAAFRCLKCLSDFPCFRIIGDKPSNKILSSVNNDTWQQGTSIGDLLNLKWIRWLVIEIRPTHCMHLSSSPEQSNPDWKLNMKLHFNIGHFNVSATQMNTALWRIKQKTLNHFCAPPEAIACNRIWAQPVQIWICSLSHAWSA